MRDANGIHGEPPGSFALASIPVWLVAIAAAAAAPTCVRIYATALEKKVRTRTEKWLAAAHLMEASPHDVSNPSNPSGASGASGACKGTRGPS
jgi:hypothetical protein